MSLTDFNTILESLPTSVNNIFFYFMGEPFLNPAAYDMIKAAKKKGIFVTTCTNGECLSPPELVASGLDEISFQIGGLTQETHERYRMQGDLNRCLTNLKAVLKERERQGRDISVMVGFIVMRHNEHQVTKLERWGQELGVDRVVAISPCVRTYEQGLEFLPEDELFWLYGRDTFEQKKQLRPKTVLKGLCPTIYFSLAIMVNGDVVPCCRDPHGRYVVGNILRQKWKEIWNGPEMQNFRYRAAKNPGKVDICYLCSGFGVPRLYWKQPSLPKYVSHDLRSVKK